jgi:hypothetical protein
MPAEQNRCAETQRLLGDTSFKLAFFQTGAQRLAGDVSTGIFSPIVPSSSEKIFFHNFITLLTPGGSPPVVLQYFIQVCVARVIQRHFCLDLRVSGLPAGQDPPPHTPGPPVIPILQRRFSHLHVDLAGPLQYSNNFNYIFTIIDRTSKWMKTIPISDMSAAACAKALTFSLISLFGVPETITSDHGPQSTSNLSFKLCEMLNISHRQTIAYHPESNGAVDSVDSIIKNFSKILDVPAVSLPRHNSSTQLPSSCQLSSSPTPLIWVCWAASSHLSSRCTMAPSPSESGHETRSLLSAASKLAWQPAPSLAARVVAADRRGCTQAVLPQPSGSHFQTRWYLHLPLRCRLGTVLKPFSYPARRFLHARDRRRHHRCHRRGTRPINGHRHRG